MRLRNSADPIRVHEAHLSQVSAQLTCRESLLLARTARPLNQLILAHDNNTRTQSMVGHQAQILQQGCG